jgi:DNA-binding Lrp family transcriptional regulator
MVREEQFFIRCRGRWGIVPFQLRLVITVSIVAFVMAKVESVRARNVLEEVRALDEVDEAFLIYGAYDLLIKGSFKTPEALSSFVVDTLRKIEGVKDTVTNVCASCE